ncbi:MAG: phytanoyl-CoA dioxygenase family protein [Lentisphaerae bacterium]|nr:phytanoyl-CoA dioxygenase family protein [Lentisphaerota bacterium]
MITSAAFTEVPLTGKTLTPEQLAFFNDNGYVLLRGFFSEQEMQAMKELRDRATARAGEAGGSFHDGPAHYDVEPLASDPTGKTMGLRKIQEAYQVEPAFREVMAQDKLLDIVEDLIGPNIYYHSSKLMCKPGNGGRRKPWHQDFAYWSGMQPNQVTVWTAVDKATTENGCMQLIPGSHKRGLIEHHQIEDLQIQEDSLADEDILVAEMDPGDTLIFSVLTLHASDPNLSPHSRLSCIIDFDSAPAPEGSQMGSSVPIRSQ